VKWCRVLGRPTYTVFFEVTNLRCLRCSSSTFVSFPMSNDEGRKDPPLSPSSKSAAKKMNDGFDTDAAAVPVPGLRMENRHGTDDIDNDGHFRFSGKKDLQLQMRSLIVNFDDEGSEWKARVTVGGDPQNGSASSKIQRKAKEWKLMQVSYEKAIEHKEQMKQGYWFSSRASNPVVVLPLQSDKTGTSLS
jgi:hypothetical protein